MDMLEDNTRPPQRRSCSSNSVTFTPEDQRSFSPNRCLKSVIVSLSSCSISIPNCSMGSPRSGCMSSRKYVAELPLAKTQLSKSSCGISVLAVKGMKKGEVIVIIKEAFGEKQKDKSKDLPLTYNSRCRRCGRCRGGCRVSG